VKRYNCREHKVKNSHYPCTECQRRIRTLSLIANDGSLLSRVRRFAVEEGMTSAKRRGALFTAAAGLEKSMP
jgi:hypothetical protein